MATTLTCACGCNPCVCTQTAGCLPDFSPLRPSFFSGQLVTAEDLNSVVQYFQAKQAMLAKLVAGWGVLGGMRLREAGTQSFRVFESEQERFTTTSGCLPTLLPNPQIVPGSILQVTAGAAIDANGQMMTLPGGRQLDIAALAEGVVAQPESRPLIDWFGEFGPPSAGDTVATQYWVVAERAEVPVRPMPQFVRVGDCNAGESCDFSRRLEDVRIRLVPDLPLLYFLHGCLETVNVPCFDEFLVRVSRLLDLRQAFVRGVDFGFVSQRILSFVSGRLRLDKTANDAIIEDFGCLGTKLLPQLAELVNDIAVSTCCVRPAVVLGRVLLASQVPSEITNEIGTHPSYLIIDDAFPYRRIVSTVATNSTLTSALMGLVVCAFRSNVDE